MKKLLSLFLCLSMLLLRFSTVTAASGGPRGYSAEHPYLYTATDGEFIARTPVTTVSSDVNNELAKSLAGKTNVIYDTIVDSYGSFYEEEKLEWHVDVVAADDNSITFDVYPLYFGSRDIFYIGDYYITHPTTVTLNVGSFFGNATSVNIQHYDHNGEVVETLSSAISEGTVTFTTSKGFSEFRLTAASAVTGPDAGDPRDTNNDGVVTCDEANGAGWYWDNTQKACVFKGGASSSGRTIPNTSAK